MAIPRSIGPYRVVRRLGKGGMAETFLACRIGTENFRRECCIKRVLPSRAVDKVLQKRFREEAAIHAKLRHANIVMAEDAGFDPEEGHYFAMEYVQGVDLDTLYAYCKTTGAILPTDCAAYIGATVADALHYSHELVIDGVHQRLVHRDVSLGNIMIDEHGHVKLMDFGIALYLMREMFTDTKLTPGNPRFLSPEHLGKRDDLDRTSDIFALGIVMHMLLCGEHPFEDTDEGTAEALLRTISTASIRPDRPLDHAGLPSALRDLVMQMLSLAKLDRPESAERVAELLDPHYRAYSARLKLAQLVRQAMEWRDESGDEANETAADGPSRSISLEVQAVTTSSARRLLSGRRNAMLLSGLVALGTLGAAWLGVRLISPDGQTSPAPLPASPSASVDAAPLQEAARTVPPLSARMAQGGGAEFPDRGAATDDAGHDRARGDSGQNPSAQSPEQDRSTLIVRVVAGCIFIDGTARGEQKVTVRRLKPGTKHVVGLAADCDAKPQEFHEVVLAPGMNRHGYGYARGASLGE